jgi:hypothetical protein
MVYLTTLKCVNYIASTRNTIVNYKLGSVLKEKPHGVLQACPCIHDEGLTKITNTNSVAEIGTRNLPNVKECQPLTTVFDIGFIYLVR